MSVRVDLNSAAVNAVAMAARRDALEDASARLNERCQANAPVDTGNLRRSHRLIPVDADATEAGVEASANYAVFVHEGHEIVAWGRRTGRMQPANPWMRRSVDQLAAGN